MSCCRWFWTETEQRHLNSFALKQLYSMTVQSWKASLQLYKNSNCVKLCKCFRGQSPAQKGCWDGLAVMPGNSWRWHGYWSVRGEQNPMMSSVTWNESKLKPLLTWKRTRKRHSFPACPEKGFLTSNRETSSAERRKHQSGTVGKIHHRLRKCRLSPIWTILWSLTSHCWLLSVIPVRVLCQLLHW